MPATLARVALITEEFRFDLQLDADVAIKRLRAESEEVESFMSTAAGAAAVNGPIHTLLKGDSQLIEVEVNPMPAGVSFDRLAPTATLVYEPLGLVRDVLIVGKTTETRADGVEKGTLLLW